MFSWRSPFGVRYDQSKSRRPKPTVQLCLEVLEDRTVPSTTSVAPFSAVASPPAVPQQLAAVSALADSTFNQYAHLLETFQIDVFADAVLLSQEIAQAESYAVQQWGRLFGFQVDASNQVTTAPVQKANSGSGSGSGSNTGHSTPPAANPPTHPPALRMTPKKAGSGVGTNSDPSSSYGTATVNGQVWLDNNGDDSLDDGEMGFQGITVDLLSGGNLVASTTTNDAAQGNNYQIQFNLPLGGGQYQIEVHIPSGDFATTPGSNCQIDSNGFSAVFTLAPGGTQTINAGMNSMNVTTNLDDPGTPIKNQVTLRDAILTGDGGPPAPAVTFSPSVTGTITLQNALAPITKSYDINGPGASTLTVDGNNAAGTIFTVNAGVTSTISGLTITGGNAQSGYGGGGIFNSGNLTLSSDDIDNNQATDPDGGGIYNNQGGTLVLLDDIVDYNTATGNGGGIFNLGQLQILGGSEINLNNAKSGGGLYNARGKAFINCPGFYTNTASLAGGGIDVAGGTVSMSVGSIVDNKAGPGGGIYVYLGSLRLMKGVNINNNTATGSDGGGIAIAGGTVSISGGTIESNKATNGQGGGIYNSQGTLSLMKGVTIGPSSSAINGGGLYLEATSTTNFGGCTVSGNTATGKGAGVAYKLGAKMAGLPLGLTDNDDKNGPVQM